MSRRLKVATAANAKTAKRKIEAKLTGAAHEPIKLPSWLMEKNEETPQTTTKIAKATASRCPG